MKPRLSKRVLSGLLVMAAHAEAMMDGAEDMHENSDDAERRQDSRDARLAIEWVRRFDTWREEKDAR